MEMTYKRVPKTKKTKDGDINVLIESNHYIQETIDKSTDYYPAPKTMIGQKVGNHKVYELVK